MDETGCDAVMVGRAALGNPWVIKEMVSYIEEGVLLEEPTIDDKIDQCLTHAKRLLPVEGEKNAIRQMRGHAPWYMKGLKSAEKKDSPRAELKVMLKFLQCFSVLLAKEQLRPRMQLRFPASVQKLSGSRLLS